MRLPPCDAFVSKGCPRRITGAGGIGRAIALHLARAGARVGIGDVDVDAAEGVALEIGADAFALALDVTDPEGFRAFLDETERPSRPSPFWSTVERTYESPNSATSRRLRGSSGGYRVREPTRRQP